MHLKKIFASALFFPIFSGLPGAKKSSPPKSLILNLFFLLAASSPPLQAVPVISEFLASNRNLCLTTGAPAFNQFGGSVPQGFALTITHTNATGVIYYTANGTDPRQYATGFVASSAKAYDAPITINAATLVRARVFCAGQWSALVEAVFYPPQDLSKLVLTEIMYNPPALGGIAGNDLEFIELKNVGTNTLDLSGLTFGGIIFTFTNGTMLAPNQFFVLARNATAFATKYPGVAVNGLYTGQLDNNGEALTLSLAVGADLFHWPCNKSPRSHWYE